jgi:hypothetical protein
MRFAVEAWAPDYGTPTDEAALAPSEEPVDVNVEVPAEHWAPIDAPAGTAPAACVLFVDGVRRVDARLWVTTDAGEVRQGICASYAAGVIRCDGRARIVAAEVRRGLFCPPEGVSGIETRHGAFPLRPAVADTPDRLSLCLQEQLGLLEKDVTERVAGQAADVVVVDGPLRDRQHVANAVGYVKTHHVAYLPQVVAEVVGQLRPGQRTPLFLTGSRWTRWSWYLRLPCAVGHTWAGIVRCEAAAQRSKDEVVAVADQLAVTLPRFASVPQKDPRAPQNLFPIAGLERELRRRLGDPALLLRALRQAAAA